METKKSDIKTDVKSLNLCELTAYLESMGEQAYRAKQIYSWLHKRQAMDFDEMTDLSAKLRSRLKETCTASVLRPVEVLTSRIDGTKKYLFALADGNVVESVRMKYRHGNSVCISSQAGCRMGCRFCASTIGGLVRNLRPSEMLEQIYRIGADIGERISHVVVMGCGEPLDNYEHFVKMVEMLSDAHGLQVSQRNITVSTCGIVPQIYRLAERRLQITLALSLHAPSQQKRQELMPIADKYQLPEVLKACEYYFEQTGRRVTYEYSLIQGVNDTPEDARQLCRLFRGKNCHLNLIPVNPVKERPFMQPKTDVVTSFKNNLEKYGINVTIRREMGRDINGACGQLRKSFADKHE